MTEITINSKASKRELIIVQTLHHLDCIRKLQRQYFKTSDKEVLIKCKQAEILADKHISEVFKLLSSSDKYLLSNYTTLDSKSETAF